MINTVENNPSSGLIQGSLDLIAELYQMLSDGIAIDNPKLTKAASRHFGGSRSNGNYTPRDSYDAMETAANLFLLETHAEALMGMNPIKGLTEVLRPFMELLPRQTDRTVEQTEFQQFSTAPTIAYVAGKLLNPKPTDIILEPSAGTGSLAIWPASIGAEVVCNEISPRRLSLLAEALKLKAHSVDAEIINDLLALTVEPTGVLMNPPFSATGGRVAQHKSIFGAKHIESALQRLQNGGRLVAIVGEGMGFDKPAFGDWWKRIASSYCVRANIRIDGKEYGKYGTTFDIQLIAIDKAGSTPGGNWIEQLENIVWGTANSLEETIPMLESIVPGISNETTIDVATQTEETREQSLFVPYAPSKLTGGQAHPAIIVESASMASVTTPNITYHPHLPAEIIDEGKLSTVQLERVVYAGQRHELRLANGERAGCYIGDGTGVGKGRILAGVIVDNWFQSRRRAIWFSVNNDLIDSTQRDLDDLGVKVPLAQINDYAPADRIALPEGVIFSSYSSLISSDKSGKHKRIDQIQDWLGNDGIVIFDEAHKAKNALAGGRGEPTQTGQAVIDLQDPKRNPEYRIVYSSATGATDVRNMAYMTRLGLWGKGTSFPSGFNEFMNEIEQGGVGAMEMVSRDMKSYGMYFSGSISFGTCPRSGKAVEYRERIHRLTDAQRKMYDHAALAWQVVLRNIELAIGITNGGNRARGTALNRFWGDHQRFFRLLICAFKAPSVIAEAQECLAAGKSVVISLIGTGEARTKDQVSKAIARGDSLEDLDFSPREIIAAMIDRAFPTTVYVDVTDPATKRTIKVPKKDANGNLVQSREALRLKQSVLDGLSELVFPENPLDQIVNYFGENQVAELTGRTRRLIRNKLTGAVAYKKRVPEGVPMERANRYEMDQFQEGHKRIAVISDAASTGISLHASNRARNKQRRVHITAELSWSADRQLQTFGRTHRSDQAVPPEYVLLSTELAGERRFSSTIARRLGSLGALTKADRGAADTGDLGKYNFETQEGRAALQSMFAKIMKCETVPGIENPKQLLRDIGLLVYRDGGEEIRREDETNVPRFLNRILALNVEDQNLLFAFFESIFDQTVENAKKSGTFDEGVTDVKAIAIRLADRPALVHKDKITGAETKHFKLDVDYPTNPLPFLDALKVAEIRNGVFMSHKKKEKVVLAIESSHHTDAGTGDTVRTFALYGPEGKPKRYIEQGELTAKYRPVRAATVRNWWTAKADNVPPIETEELNLIGGAILPLWQRLKTTNNTQLKVVRVMTNDGQRIVGVKIPQERVGQVLRALGIGRTISDPQEIFDSVLKNKDQVQLVDNMELKTSMIHGEEHIELKVTDSRKFDLLRSLGLINEQIDWKQRFFIPTDEEKGLSILTALLGVYPTMVEAKEENKETHIPLAEMEHATESVVIDIRSWAIRPAVSEIKEDQTTTNAPATVKPFAIGNTSEAATNITAAITDAKRTSDRKPQTGKKSIASSQLSFEFMFDEPISTSEAA